LATLDELGQALKTRIETIGGLRVAWLAPDRVNIPMAIIIPNQIRYHTRSGDGMRVTFAVRVYAASVQHGSWRGMEAVIPYLDKSGVKSIKAALEADTRLGGIASFMQVHGAETFDDEEADQWWGAVIEVEIGD